VAKANSGLGQTQVDFSFDRSLPKEATSWKTLLKLLLSSSILFLWIPHGAISPRQRRDCSELGYVYSWMRHPMGGHRLGGTVSNATCFASCNSRHGSLHLRKFLLVDRLRSGLIHERMTREWV